MKPIVQPIEVENKTTADGKPDGGTYIVRAVQPVSPDNEPYESVVMLMRWQQGPLVDADGNELEPNGLFLETALRACCERLRYYQTTKFNSRENAVALTHMETALLWLGARARRREEEGSLGTHQLDKQLGGVPPVVR